MKSRFDPTDPRNALFARDLRATPFQESCCFGKAFFFFCSNTNAEMTPDNQCETLDSDSNWEDVESEQDLYPTHLKCTVKIGLILS